MKQVLQHLSIADYHFVVGAIASLWSLTDDSGLQTALEKYEASGSDTDRTHLDELIEREIGYLGSSEIAYFVRSASGKKAGLPFSTVVADVARSLDLHPDRLTTINEQLVDIVTSYATVRFAELTAEEQQQMLVDLGVDKKRAEAFVKRSAGVFAPPLLIEAFNVVVVEGLIKKIIFGTIARFLGREATRKLLTFILGRFPWWVSWVGPVAWMGSIGWTVLDLQGPAYRKTIPIVLYLGLCVMRHESAES
jgi:hypothetical protein